MKVLLNKCYGGPSLSDEFCQKYPQYDTYFFEATDQTLCKLVEEFGEDAASGSCAKLRVVDIPDGFTDYTIDEYDGIESIIYVMDGKLNYA